VYSFLEGGRGVNLYVLNLDFSNFALE